MCPFDFQWSSLVALYFSDKMGNSGSSEDESGMINGVMGYR
jgi:hypothetical protein